MTRHLPTARPEPATTTPETAAGTPATDAASSASRQVVEFHEALRDLLRVYQFRDRDRICCHDISVTQCHALDRLITHGPLRLNDLADRLYLDKSTASRVIDALEAKGYVRRTADPRDGRALRLHVTAAGEALFRRIEEGLLEQEARLLEDFDPQVRRHVTRLLRRLAESARARFTCGNAGHEVRGGRGSGP